MIITRAPYRISFFGGGTDYHTWYAEHGGDVLSTTINHYNYISCRYRRRSTPNTKTELRGAFWSIPKASTKSSTTQSARR